MLSPEEAAEALGVARSTVYDLIRMRVFVSVKVGRYRKIPACALREYVERLASSGDVVA